MDFWVDCWVPTDRIFSGASPEPGDMCCDEASFLSESFFAWEDRRDSPQQNMMVFEKTCIFSWAPIDTLTLADIGLIIHTHTHTHRFYAISSMLVSLDGPFWKKTVGGATRRASLGVADELRQTEGGYPPIKCGLKIRVFWWFSQQPPWRVPACSGMFHCHVWWRVNPSISLKNWSHQPYFVDGFCTRCFTAAGLGTGFGHGTISEKWCAELSRVVVFRSYVRLSTG